MNSLEKKYDRLGITLLLAEHKDYIDFMLLEIPNNKQNKGYGTKAMLDVNRFADKENKKVVLIPSSCYGSKLQRLKRFYRQFGYKTHGKTMVRLPNGN
jgi:histone acetyltransferase (RNA polymerase elongator complex component)